MSTLKSQIEALAQHFAAQVLTVIRSASMEDIIGHDIGATRTAKVATRTRAAKATRTAAAKPSKAPRRRARLARRSADQIQAQVASVVALLKKSPEGLRSEEIRGIPSRGRRRGFWAYGRGVARAHRKPVSASATSSSRAAGNW